MDLPEFTDRILTYLYQQNIPNKVDAAVILGSGLGSFADHINNVVALPYSDIPDMPESTVNGHEGELIFGTVGGKNIITFSGRLHYYEGFEFEEMAIPVYIAKSFDVDKLIISNAAGAINTSFSVGDLMVIESVMRGNLNIAPRGYKKYRYNHHQWVDKVRKLAAGIGLKTQTGTYLYVKGPNYETKAEIRAFRKMGADAVGMSTATELFEAARLGIKSTAISLITNMSTGITGEKLYHAEVEAAADLRGDDFARLVETLISEF